MKFIVLEKLVSSLDVRISASWPAISMVAYVYEKVYVFELNVISIQAVPALKLKDYYKMQLMLNKRTICHCWLYVYAPRMLLCAWPYQWKLLSSTGHLPSSYPSKLPVAKTEVTIACVVCCRSLQDDFDTYQASVQRLNDESKQTPQVPQQGAVCEICHKTKFADGIGHKCHYCGVRSCARCGGKIALRSNKVS